MAPNADASVTVTKTNSTGASVNGGSVNQTISFSAADFGGLANIAKVTVSITFSKLNLLGLTRAEYREVGFILTGAGTSEVLIRDATKGGGSFNRGERGASFNGTILFDQDAAVVVNDDKNLMKAGTFRPDDGDLGDFSGRNALGNWTLTIIDSDGGLLNTGVSVDSWTVSITSLTPVPESGAIGMWGGFAMLAGVIVLHRPRRADFA